MADDLDDRFGGELAGAECVINSFTGEGFNYPRSVTNEKQIFVRGRNWCSRQGRNRAPGLIVRKIELSLRPCSEGRNCWRRSDQAKVELILVHRRLTRITFRQKLQHDSISEIARKWNVRLQRDAFALGTRQQITQPRDGRVAAVRADDDTCGKSLPDDVDLPIFCGGAHQREQRRFFANLSAERSCAAKKNIIEDAA